MLEKKETDKEKARKKLALQKKYVQRITIAKHGREAFGQKDFLLATKKYNEYLGILAQLHEVEDIFSLSPNMFDNKKEVTEMLLVAHVYWEIARINEMTPKLQKNYQKALNQFVKFTINQPYQVLNAEMLRKYIKKNKADHPQIHLLNEAYQQIFVQSKKCYIATMCLGPTHPDTETLRRLKQAILPYAWGRVFVESYYRLSSRFVNLCEKNSLIKLVSKIIFLPILSLLAKFLQISIFK